VIAVQELDRVLSGLRVGSGSEEVDLHRAAGRVLAREVATDRDIPPYDRVCMDGFALRWDEWNAGRRSYALSGSRPAGSERGAPAAPGSCVEVTTGSAAPVGCDLVVRLEDSEVRDEGILLHPDHVIRGQNLHWRGTDARAGAVVLPEGIPLGAPEIGVLASVGVSKVPVRTLPRVAVCSTGNELVDVETQPLPHQVRRSNDRFVEALLATHGLPTATRMPLRDVEDELVEGIERVLAAHEVVVLSGGVSASKVDLVPGALKDLGVEILAHGIAQKPGKPFLCGIGPQGQLVAALPGNPMAAAVCMRRHVLPALLRAVGRPLVVATVRLAEPFERLPKLVRYAACTVRRTESGCLEARLKPGNGSGDYLHLAGSHGILEILPGSTPLEAGALAEFHPW
jgi:molybdopterin molybdotransferase